MNLNIQQAPLYEVQYKPNGTKYTFHFAKLMEKFNATNEEVHYAIAFGVRVPDGPLKGLFIRVMSPSEGEAIQMAYKRKLDKTLQTLQLIIGTTIPDSIW